MTILEALRTVTTSIRDWAAEKFIEQNHGAENANKILTVGNDGMVVPKTNIIHVGATEPTDANVKVWINTSESDIGGGGAVAILPRIATITLVASAWSGEENPWSQPIAIAGVTASTKADLQPSAAQIVALQDSETSLMIENNDGALVCYAIGNKPTVDYTMQVLLQEVALL